jgi:hypothetical protein
VDCICSEYIKNQEEEASAKILQDENMEWLVPVLKWMVEVYYHGRNPGWSQEAKVEFEILFDMVLENWDKYKNTNVEQFVMEK